MIGIQVYDLLNCKHYFNKNIRFQTPMLRSDL